MPPPMATSCASTKRRPMPRRFPTTPNTSTPPWETTCSPPGRCCASSRMTRPSEQSSRFRAGYSAVPRQPVRSVRLQLSGQPDRRRAGGRRGLLARRRNHRRLLRGQHGPAQVARVEPLQPAVASAYVELSRPAGEVHFRRREPARPGDRFDHLRRLDSFRRRGTQFRAGPMGSRACRRAGGGFHHPG